MSDEMSKEKKSKRIHADETAIARQIRIAKDLHMDRNGRWKYLDQPHRNHKKHILNCGDSKCAMCGNPRKFFKEKTIQEKRFDQMVFEEV
jgi:serine/threonine protein phosphatase PrpC